MKLLLVVLIFFIVSALLIISNNNLKMYEQENVQKFSELYVKWIDDVYKNIQSITGETIKQNWFPQ